MIEWSHWHYVVIEKRLAPGWRTVVRGATRPLMPLARAWRRSWRRTSPKEEVSEVRMETDTATQQAMGRAVMQQMEQRTLQSIREAVRQELLPQVQEEALALARQELEEQLQHQREQLRDTFAKQRQALTGELEDELERREELLRRQTRDSYEERLLTLKDDLAAATTARDQVTALLVSLVTQLVAEKPKRYLYDAGITELDLITLNQVLAPQGLQIRSEFRHSERQVACTLKNGAGQRTVFWLETAVPGVAVEGEGGGEQAETHVG
jgi:phosphopantetheine adenylyltransferase